MEKSKIRQAGFTLAELLLAVAILIVLFALGVPALITIQKNLRQRELDSKAEEIYTAVQNKLSELYSTGYSENYDPGTHDKLYELKDIPGDFDSEISGNILNENNHVYYFLSSEEMNGIILEDDTISEDLQNGHFVIEIIPYAFRENSTDEKQLTAATVYAVYYSEDVIDVTEEYGANNNYLIRYRSKTARQKLTDARVGYYGGSNPSSGTGTSALTVTNIEITSNDVVNKGIVKVRKPISISEDVTFTFELKDTSGNTRKIVYEESSDRVIVDDTYNTSASEIGLSVSHIGVNYTFTFTLDDISSNGTRFDTLYGNNSTYATKLITGANISLSASAECENDFTVSKGYGIAYGNSIYAYPYEDNDGTGFVYSENANISNPRHLQNLDESSNVASTIKSATLLNDISFKEDTDFYTAYINGYFNGTTTITTINSNGSTSLTRVPNFKGITNNNLTSFSGLNEETGENYVIYNLSSTSNSSNGLFASVENKLNVSNVTLVGTRINSNSSTGGLIGTNRGNVSIKNVELYLSTTNGDIPTAILSENNLESVRWLQGSTVGGLIGNSSGTVTIEESFASTVLGNEGSTTGGLVGNNTGNLLINKSYTDSYLYGKSIGGLIGNTTGNVTITSAYTAGFIGLDASEDAKAAGIAIGSVDSMSSVYTIMAYYNVDSTGGITKETSDESLGKVGTFYSTASRIGAIANVYYLRSGEDIVGTSNEIESMTLNDDFATPVSVTTYRLMGQSLNAYQYKILKGIDHYGDYDVSFTPGALVYYEKYDDGSIGFDGAGVDISVSTKGTIVGDGYGIIFGDKQTKDIEIVIDGKSYTIDVDSVTPIETTNAGKTYYIYPLDKTIVNPTSVSSYYSRITIKSDSGNKYYDFNPHFARTQIEVLSEDAATSKLPSEVSIRSPRHLNDLSKYYDTYYRALLGSSVTYKQERNMDYASYDWNSFTTVSSVSEQGPIGISASTSFNATYDGSCYEIGNISFVTENGHYIGMFGHTTGTIKNVVIATQYATDSTGYRVKRNTSVGTNDYLYSGILAGYNNGTITNSAVAGYYMSGSTNTINGYQNSTLYVGGLVGYNDTSGSISNSSADSPKLSLNMYRATCYAGGLVGSNAGTITNSYALNHITSMVRGGTTIIAGFAGNNTGRITNSYCATALTSSGDGSYSYLFSPSNSGGIVSSSYYLYRGSYQFVDGLYSYNGDASTTSGTYKTYDELKELAEGSTTTKENSLYHGLTKEDVYPYRAVVKDASGALVHYGEWQVAPDLGIYGIFYWEHEEQGQNDGYKITYIGVENGEVAYESTLCEEHDDGGVITEYGYGYYVLSKSDSDVTVNSNGIELSKGTYNTGAKSALEDQLPGLTLYPYTTTTDTSGSYIYLSSSDINGSVTITYKNDSTTFYISPFFANALSMQVDSSKYNSASSEAKKYLTTSSSASRSVLSSATIPGSSTNKYEIRSADQLQYINWNYSNRSANSLVTTSNYQNFNYLIYTRYTSTASQQLSNAYNNANANLYFEMTHDLNAESITNFTPIAGQTTSSSNNQSGGYNSILYTWFGSHFDGQSYKIQELNISSKSYTVGLFGVTVDASIKNVILYSSNSIKAIIQRNTSNTDTQGAYAIGGLIGIAYNYNDNASSNIIENCAIAGYRIIDNSKNQLTLGEANIGGLVGVANVNIDRCSAVVDIEINAEHQSSSGRMTVALYGNFMRVGGIAGAVQDSITNSYSGGNIKVTNQNLLNETYSSANATYSNYVSTTNSNGVGALGSSTHIYVAGIAGSGFTMNYQNFTNNSSLKDGIPYVENCYTYMDFPDLEGTIRSISMITSVADRYSWTTASIVNCYYLDTSADINTTKAPYYRFQDRGFSAQTAISKGYLPDMIQGSARWTYLVLEGKENMESKLTTVSLTKKTYAELASSSMTNLLGSSWHKVSTVDSSGQTVDGKYSFPAGKAELDGKNYPFPTVIQEDSFNMHYGEWPLYGPYFTKGIETLDIFESMADDEYAYIQLTLNKNETDISDLEFKVLVNGEENNEIAEIVTNTDGSYYTVDSDGNYVIKVKALKTGTVEIVADYKDRNTDLEQPKCTLTITANLVVSAEKNTFTLGVNESATSTLSAKSSGGTYDYSKNANTTWESTSSMIGQDPAVTLTPGSGSSKNILGLAGTGNNATVTVKATYNYHGNEYSSSTSISVYRLGAIGLAGKTNGTTYAYNEANIVSEVQAETIKGSKASYSTDTAPSSTNDYYLYVVNDSNDILSTALESNNITANVLDANGDEVTGASVTFGNSLSSYDNNGFKTLNAKVKYRSTSTDKVTGLTLVVYVKDTNTNNTYELTLTDVAITPSPFTITLDANGGSFTNVTTIDIDQVGEIIPSSFEVPTRTGYDFKSWSYDKEGTQVIDNKTALTPKEEDYSIYANWKPSTADFTIKNNIDETTITQTYTYDAFSIDLNAYAKDRATFNGLYSDSTYTTLLVDKDGNVQDGAQDIINAMILNDEEKVLYAEYIPSYTLTLKTKTETSEYTFTSITVNNLTTDVGYTPSDVVEGYTLEGWYASADETSYKVLNADGSVVQYAAGYALDGHLNISSDTTLYAKWTTEAKYVLADSFEYNNEYLITNTNVAGEAYVMIAETNDNDSLKSSKVTIKIDGDTTYISASEAIDSAKWVYVDESFTDWFGTTYSRTNRLKNTTNGTTVYAYCDGTQLRLDNYYGRNSSYQWNYSNNRITTRDGKRYLEFNSRNNSFTFDSSPAQHYAYLFKYTEESMTFIYPDVSTTGDDVVDEDIVDDTSGAKENDFNGFEEVVDTPVVDENTNEETSEEPTTPDTSTDENSNEEVETPEETFDSEQDTESGTDEQE